MSRLHLVQQGECLTSIAVRYGFRDVAALYNDPANAALRRARPNPNVLLPGDVVNIPERAPESFSRATDSVHTFTLSRPTRLLRIVLKDTDGQPMSGLDYSIEIGGRNIDGCTDAEGLLSARVPISENFASITVLPSGITRKVAIGHLDPVQANGRVVVTGIQARLNNLGFQCGAVDGVFGPATRAAVLAFETKVLGRAEPKGKPDAEVRRALLREHGC